MECPAGKCECVHYRNSGVTETFGCLADSTEEGWYFSKNFTQCPWPSKIQAPKKDPLEECADEIDSTYLDVDFTEVIDILKKHWTKPGDVDEAWIKACEIGDLETTERIDVTAISKIEFVRALKAGGFEVG